MSKKTLRNLSMQKPLRAGMLAVALLLTLGLVLFGGNLRVHAAEPTPGATIQFVGMDVKTLAGSIEGGLAEIVSYNVGDKDMAFFVSHTGDIEATFVQIKHEQPLPVETGKTWSVLWLADGEKDLVTGAGEFAGKQFLASKTDTEFVDCCNSCSAGGNSITVTVTTATPPTTTTGTPKTPTVTPEPSKTPVPGTTPKASCNNGFGNGPDGACKTQGNGANQDNNGQQQNGHVPGGATKNNGKGHSK